MSSEVYVCATHGNTYSQNYTQLRPPVTYRIQYRYKVGTKSGDKLFELCTHLMSHEPPYVEYNSARNSKVKGFAR